MRMYKYNNTIHRTIKIKPVDVTSDSCTEYNKDLEKKNSKFKVVDHVRISEYKNIFAKKFLLLVKLKIQFAGLMVLVT